jgi:hypothetical protein
LSPGRPSLLGLLTKQLTPLSAECKGAHPWPWQFSNAKTVRPRCQDRQIIAMLPGRTLNPR